MRITREPYDSNDPSAATQAPGSQPMTIRDVASACHDPFQERSRVRPISPTMKALQSAECTLSTSRIVQIRLRRCICVRGWSARTKLRRGVMKSGCAVTVDSARSIAPKGSQSGGLQAAVLPKSEVRWFRIYRAWIVIAYMITVNSLDSGNAKIDINDVPGTGGI